MRHHFNFRTVTATSITALALLLPSTANALESDPYLSDTTQPSIIEPTTDNENSEPASADSNNDAAGEPNEAESNEPPPIWPWGITPDIGLVYPTAEPDEFADAEITGGGEFENYWIRTERIINENEVSQRMGWDSPLLDTTSVIGRQGSKWDALLRLAPDSTWASGLRWTLEQAGERSCLAQSKAAPLSGEIVILVDEELAPEDIHAEYTTTPRDISQLECDSGQFATLKVNAIDDALAITIPDPETVTALRLRLDRPVGVQVIRLHTVNPSKNNQDLWTVASRSTKESDWQQSPASITATPQFSLPATTTSRDVLVSSIDEPEVENSGRNADEDPPSDEPGQDDSDSVAESANAANRTEDEPEEPEKDAEKRAGSSALTRLPDAGIDDSNGFLIGALAALLPGAALAFTMRPARAASAVGPARIKPVDAPADKRRAISRHRRAYIAG